MVENRWMFDAAKILDSWVEKGEKLPSGAHRPEEKSFVQPTSKTERKMAQRRKLQNSLPAADPPPPGKRWMEFRVGGELKRVLVDRKSVQKEKLKWKKGGSI